jgi:hypothetical protein
MLSRAAHAYIVGEGVPVDKAQVALEKVVLAVLVRTGEMAIDGNTRIPRAVARSGSCDGLDGLGDAILDQPAKLRGHGPVFAVGDRLQRAGRLPGHADREHNHVAGILSACLHHGDFTQYTYASCRIKAS